MREKLFYILISLNIAMPGFVLASFERDLYFGLSQDPEVTKLQEFLKNQGVYGGPVTGGFFSLTREAVKKFQEREQITPAAGFFGPLTRSQANTLLAPSLSGEEVVASLTAQIAALQARLAELQEKLKEEQSTPTQPAAAESQVQPTPVLPKKLMVKGGKDITFPEIAVVSLKLGDISLTNGTDNSVLIAQLRLKITDNMDSPLNRGKEVFFILRRGTSTADAEISRTGFTFNSNDPVSSLYGPHIASANLSIPETMKPGESKEFGLWIDNFDYVVRGSLDMEFDSISATTAVESEGAFRFKLTR